MQYDHTTQTRAQSYFEINKENLVVGKALNIRGNSELINRIIESQNNEGYVCTISKSSEGINEKTYENTRDQLKYVCENTIPIGHQRYDGLLIKLNEKGN